MKADIKSDNNVSTEGISALTVNRFVDSVPAEKETLRGCRISSDILASAVKRISDSDKPGENKKAAPHGYGLFMK